ncbi:hypothetical protein FH972_026637 [Carpinus fangiana]|uniref:Protein kinase domain-containing protein n=1 Tax=Carpinus fangiana TaxID=176857 RepID=A0A5N6L4L4_9ROSI|nr:hypothetical protein FH972_026637 [Carpinus fangiana]
MADKIEEIPKLIKDAGQRQYLPGEMLGRGGFASVWRAKVVDRRTPPEAGECALKVVRRSIRGEQLRTRFKFELGIHNKLRHPNIVAFYRAFTQAELTFVSLELCENGSLTDVVKRRKFLTMGEIRRWLIQLCGAVKYLHLRDVVHRDIKAGNVFLDADMNVKLGDFGLASIMVPTKDLSSYTRRTTFCGTPNYLAPEVLSRGGHDKSVDIWAIGILAYYLAVGRAPFHSKSKDEIYERVRNADYAWPDLGPESNEIPEDLKSLVATLLVPEAQRPTPDEVVRHPFFAHGFVPDKIDPLARTRRPRWARMPAKGLPESTAAYEKCCRESRVGVAPPQPTLKRKRKTRHDEELLLRTLEYEFSEGIRLEVPLPEGQVYHAYVYAVQQEKKLPPAPPVILEDVKTKQEQETQAPSVRRVIQPPQLPQLPAYPSSNNISNNSSSSNMNNSRDAAQIQRQEMPPPPRPVSVASRPRAMGSTRRALTETTANRGSVKSNPLESRAEGGKVARTVAAFQEAAANAASSRLTMPSLGRAKRPRRAGACYE